MIGRTPPARWRALLCLIVGVPALGWSAWAQGSQSVPLPPRPPASPHNQEPSAPPYEVQLDRLAELMGTLAFLRDLCGDGDGAAWHDKMAALLDAEAQTDALRDRLAGSYNRGFQGYQLTYRSCTPSARTAIARSLSEGQTITRDLSARFGGE